MPQYQDFLLPDVGEGLTEADILSWWVAPGDTVVVNQILVEVETAKAAVELPSPFAGVVRTLHAEPGQTLPVGQPLITIDVDPGAGGSATPKREPVLVGYGVSTELPVRRPRRARSEEPTPSANGTFAVGPTSAPSAVLAKPPVRKLAKDLGVDLTALTPTGPNGSVSREDVQSASTTRSGTVTSINPRREERIPVRGVRKHTAAAMVQSAFTAPHVSEFITVDVSATMELRERVADRREFTGVKLSPLVFVARAVLWAVRRTPSINSTWDEAAGEIVLKHYVNLGIAAATDRGLLVPNIKDADRLSLHALAVALTDLTETARAGRATPADLAAGTITITNLGVFGVDAGTPILNPGEAAILAVGAIARRPWVVMVDGVERIEPRWVAQLSVSFDHRIVDGQQGSQFLADVAAVLGDPGLALL